MDTNAPIRIVVIGGGTGTYTVLKGLKKFPPHKVDLTAIVSSADSGGSTGQLRDEFGYLPVGDMRMALLGLSEGESDPILRDLFTHRFAKGEGLKGHNVGNLLLVALTDLYGSEEKAVKAATKILRLRGNVLPVTESGVTLAAEYNDGVVKKGETYIDQPAPRLRQASEPHQSNGAHIARLWTEPETNANTHALEAIAHADIVVLSPGDLYTSLLANIVVPGMPEVLSKTNASLIYVTNLMTKHGQTHGYTAQEHLDEVVAYTGRTPDHVLVNETPLPEDILARYEKEKEHPVADDLGEGDHIIRTDLLAEEEVKQQDGDTLKRSLIRHDPQKLADALKRCAGL